MRMYVGICRCIWYVGYRDSLYCIIFFFFQAEDGIRDLVRSRGLGDVYKRQVVARFDSELSRIQALGRMLADNGDGEAGKVPASACLLYTSDAADERSSVDLGGRRIIKKKKTHKSGRELD